MIKKNNVYIFTTPIDAIKSAKSWTYLISQAAKDKEVGDAIDITEKRFETVKPNDVVNVGHKNKEILNVQERQLEEIQDSDELVKTTEAQLNPKVEESEYVIIEARMEDEKKWNSYPWSGNDIKTFRIVNNRQKANAKANELFYESQSKRKKGGAVTASKKKK
jgi:hypothetical protein